MGITYAQSNILSPAPNLGAGWGGGSERYRNATSPSLTPHVGGRGFSARSAHAIALLHKGEVAGKGPTACVLAQT